jgi:hypothetical protein
MCTCRRFPLYTMPGSVSFSYVWSACEQEKSVPRGEQQTPSSERGCSRESDALFLVVSGENAVDRGIQVGHVMAAYHRLCMLMVLVQSAARTTIRPLN